MINRNVDLNIKALSEYLLLICLKRKALEDIRFTVNADGRRS